MDQAITLLGPNGQPLAPRIGAEAFIASSQTHPDLRNWYPRAGSADSDYLPEQGRIVSRSRDLERNHGVAHGVRQTQHDNVVGCGLRLSAKPAWEILGKDEDWAETWGDQVEALFQTWWNTVACDAAEMLVGDGLSSQMWNSAFLNGEGLALPLWLPERGYRFATCLQVIEPDRLCNPNGRPDTEKLRAGVEINSYGKAEAYWIRKVHPGDLFVGFGAGFSSGAGINDWERIPAKSGWGRRRVIHANPSREDRPSQSRGIPALVSVMRQFKVLGDLTNAELKAAVVNAMVAIITESAVGQESLVELLSSDPAALKNYQDSLANRQRASVDFTGGMILPLQLGERVSSFTSNRPNNSFDPFVTTLFRHIGAGLNIPYELLMKDFSKTNYSSARAALNEAWRFFRGRRKWIATYWCTPVYTLWLEEAINLGLIEAPDFYENWEAYCRCFWIGDGRGYVDPLKEQQASRGRMEDNTSTLEEECAEQGGDWKHKLRQRARELKEMKRLEDKYGIKFSTPSAPAPAAPLTRKEKLDAGEDLDENEEERTREERVAASVGGAVAAAIAAQPAPQVHVHQAAPQKVTKDIRRDDKNEIAQVVETMTY